MCSASVLFTSTTCPIPGIHFSVEHSAFQRCWSTEELWPVVRRVWPTQSLLSTTWNNCNVIRHPLHYSRSQGDLELQKLSDERSKNRRTHTLTVCICSGIMCKTTKWLWDTPKQCTKDAWSKAQEIIHEEGNRWPNSSSTEWPLCGNIKWLQVLRRTGCWVGVCG